MELHVRFEIDNSCIQDVKVTCVALRTQHYAITIVSSYLLGHECIKTDYNRENF